MAARRAAALLCPLRMCTARSCKPEVTKLHQNTAPDGHTVPGAGLVESLQRGVPKQAQLLRAQQLAALY